MTRKAAENGGSYEAGWWLSPTILKNMSSSVGNIIPNIWETCLKTTNQEKIPLPLSIINTGYEYVSLYIIA